MKKKIAAFCSIALLVTSFALSGCVFTAQSPIGPDKVSSYAEGLGAESYDGKGFLKKMNKTYGFDEDGSYAVMDSSELKKYFDDKGISDGNTVELEYESSMVSGAIYFLGKYEGDGKCQYEVFAVEFEEEKDAEDYFDDVVEIIEANLERIKSSATTDSDSGKDDEINYFVSSKIFGIGRLNPPLAIYNAVYQDGKYLLFITGNDYGTNFNTEDAIEGWCDEFGIVSPTNF